MNITVKTIETETERRQHRTIAIRDVVMFIHTCLRPSLQQINTTLPKCMHASLLSRMHDIKVAPLSSFNAVPFATFY